MDQYLGELRLMANNFAPVGWAFCAGQQLPISEYDALFTLIGTTYGGDGESTFNLPNLQGRVPVHVGAGLYPLGEFGGVETVTLTSQTMPMHTHAMLATNDTGVFPDPSGKVPGRSSTPNVDMYLQDMPTVPMNADAVSQVGKSEPHDNLQPYLAINVVIALEGIYPQQN